MPTTMAGNTRFEWDGNDCCHGWAVSRGLAQGQATIYHKPPRAEDNSNVYFTFGETGIGKGNAVTPFSVHLPRMPGQQPRALSTAEERHARLGWLWMM